jgi:putative MFS transporter
VYAYSPENFPTRVRGTGLGFAGAIGRLGGILGPAIVGIIYSTAGLTWVLHINMILLIIAIIVMFMLGRETKRKTLEEISFERTPTEKVASKVAASSV